jgi:hypothetical protein
MTTTPEITPFDPFAFDEGTTLDLELIGSHAADTWYEAVQNAANGTARSKQQQDMFIGISTLGHCRNYAALMLKQTPFSDVRDKTAAFYGTVAGDAIEAQLFIDHPGWKIQEKLVFPIPSGGEIPGTGDVVIPWSESVTYEKWLTQFETDDDGVLTYDGPKLYLQGVWDGKSKAELETIKKSGPSQQQIFQVHAYAKAAIAKGLLNPDYPIVVGDVFFDRSGRDVVPHGIFHEYKEDVIEFIDVWINDVKYAALNGLEAEKDMTRDWCHNWCEYATVCRGFDTDVEGLIEDPGTLTTINEYRTWQKLSTEAEKKKKALKTSLEGISGSTGEVNVRWTWVNPSERAASTIPGYFKLDVRDVPKPKTPAKRKPKAKAEPAAEVEA